MNTISSNTSIKNNDIKGKKYDERLNKIIKEIFNPYSIINIDSLLDCFNALVYEINVKSINNNKNLKTLLNRIMEKNEYISKNRINMDDFTVLKILGKGAFGEVSLVKHNDTNNIYALKAMNKYEMIKRDEACCLWEEREIMALSETEWFVKMYYAFQDIQNIYMVMEFVQGGDLVNLMSNYDIDEKIAKFYLAEVCIALDFLHNLGFIHRDVKPDNMLLDKKGHIKLCDFGTCIRMDKSGKVSCNIAVGTPDYISPEVLMSQNNNVSYGKEADWWSVGVFVYEFIVGDTPFYAQSLVGTYNNIMNYKKSLSMPEDIDMSKEYEHLIRSFLCSPDTRLGKNGLKDIQNHKFFTNINWNNIRNMTPPIVPDLNNELDTSCFEDIAEIDNSTKDAPKITNSDVLFKGDHFPFIGFSYSKDYNKINDTVILDEKEQKTILNAKSISHEEGFTTINNNNIKIIQYQKEIDDLKLIMNQKEKLIHELENIIKNNEEKNKEIELKFNSLNKQNSITSDIREENNKLLCKIKDLENELNDHIQEMKKLEVSYKFSKITENETKLRYEEIVSEIIPLKDEIEHIKNEKTSIINECKKLKEEQNENIKELENIRKNYESVKIENDELNGHINKLKKLYEKEKIDELIEIINENKIENKNLLKKISIYENDIKNYEQILNKQQEKTCAQEKSSDVENIQLLRKYNLIVTEKESLLKYIQELESKNNEFIVKIDKITKQIRLLTNENIALEYKLKEITSKYTANTMKENRILEERSKFYDKNIELNQQLDQINLKLRSSQLRVSQYEEEMSYHETRIKSQNEKIDSLKMSLQKSEQYYNDIKLQFDELLFKNNTLELNVLNKQDEIVLLKNKLQQLSNDNIILQNEIDTKNKILEYNDQINNTITTVNQDELIHLAEIEKIKSELKNITDLYENLKITSTKQIDNERIRKEEAIKKLNQVLSIGANTIKQIQGGVGGNGGTKKDKIEAKNERKVEHLYKQLQMDFHKETQKHTNIIKDYDDKIYELNNIINELRQQIEQLKKQKSFDQVPSSIINTSSKMTNKAREYSMDMNEFNLENDTIIKQSFLFLPQKAVKSSRKLNWNRIVATLTSKTFTIYKDTDINPDSILYIINIESIYYVRAISQNDLIRSTPTDILKIFQIIYNDDFITSSSSASNINQDIQQLQQQTELSSGEKFTIISNHCFVHVQYHMPTTCDICGKGLWGFIKSSYALECKNCHFRCHKEHSIDHKSIPRCRDYDKRRMAKEILLMAPSPKEQQCWIDLILSLVKSCTSMPQQQQQDNTSIINSNVLLERNSSNISKSSSKSYLSSDGSKS